MADPLLDGPPPRQRADARLETREGQAVVELDGHDALCALNATAVALWELCDGATTVDEMVEAVCELWGTSRETVLPDVLGALHALEDAGAIVSG